MDATLKDLAGIESSLSPLSLNVAEISEDVRGSTDNLKSLEQQISEHNIQVSGLKTRNTDSQIRGKALEAKYQALLVEIEAKEAKAKQEKQQREAHEKAQAEEKERLQKEQAAEADRLREEKE